MSVQSRTIIGLALLLTLPLSAHAQNDAPTDSAAGHVAHLVHDDTRIGLETRGTGWAKIDIEARQPTDLRFSLSNPIFDNLCMFNPQGFGIYDKGHHTIVHLFREGHNPFAERFFIWLGSPHSIMPSIQTGVCGTSDPLSLATGERAHLVIASTLPGFRIDLIGANATEGAGNRPLTLSEHPDLAARHTDHTAVVDGDTTSNVATVAREWRQPFETGPAALYGIPWMHAEAAGGLPHETAHDAGLYEWGFENATFSGTAPVIPLRRGFTDGGNVDWLAVFPGFTDGGATTGFVRQNAVVGAYTGSVESGAWFLSVPLAQRID